VQRYFRWIGRDPTRTLLLLTPGFHLRHELPPVRLEDLAERPGVAAPKKVPPGGREAPQPREKAAQRAHSVDSGSVGWLNAQTEPELRRRVLLLQVTLLDESETGNRAQVLVRIDPQEGAPFDQRFHLVRHEPASPWRIDSIEQLDVGPGVRNLRAAFAAYPNEATHRRIQRLKLRRR
jgi:hypothetical protein